MKASILLLKIKDDMEKLSSYRSMIQQKLSADENPGTISSIMTRYNYGNFIEILDKKGVDQDFEIDDIKLNNFQRDLRSIIVK
jgi:hypothetical protein